MKRFVMIVSVAVVCVSRDKATQVGKRTFPITITKNGFILVNVRVSDAVNGRFILDTGAGINLVSNSMVRRVASTPRGRFTGIRYDGEPVNLELKQIKSLSIGRFRQEKPVVAPLALLDSLKIDGILSMKFFEHHPFTLDVRDSLLVFETPRSLPRRWHEASPRALKIDDQRGISIDCFCDVQLGDSLRLQCILDTGSFSSYIDVRYCQPLGIDTASSTVRKRTRQGTFGAWETEYFAAMPSIALWHRPATTLKNLPVVFQDRLIYDGLLGMDFMVGRTITFDIAERRFAIRP